MWLRSLTTRRAHIAGALGSAPAVRLAAPECCAQRLAKQLRFEFSAAPSAHKHYKLLMRIVKEVAKVLNVVLGAIHALRCAIVSAFCNFLVFAKKYPKSLAGHKVILRPADALVMQQQQRCTYA